MSGRRLAAAFALYGFVIGSNAAETPGTLAGSFSVTATGQASYIVPIQAPPGIAGLEPKLSLAYSSLSGNGVLGVGWSLDGFSSITRCRKTIDPDGISSGVKFDPSDRFCLDGKRLVQDPNNANEYRKEIDDFSKVVRLSKVVDSSVGLEDPAEFRVYTKSGLILDYGTTSDSRIRKEAAPRVIVEWKISRITDRSSNSVEFYYSQDSANGEYLPTIIRYGNNSAAGILGSRAIHFVYGQSSSTDRTDKSITYRNGARYGVARRLNEIITYVAVTSVTPSSLADSSQVTGAVVQKYRMSYESSPATSRTRLKSVQICGQRSASEPNPGTELCLPPTEFGYSGEALDFPFEAAAVDLPQNTEVVGALAVGDFNADGTKEFLSYFVDSSGSSRWHVYGRQPSGIEFVQTLPELNNDAGDIGCGIANWGFFSLEFVRILVDDLNGDGYDDLLFVCLGSGDYGTNYVYLAKVPTSTANTIAFVQEKKFDGSSPIPKSAFVFSTTSNFHLSDFNGDGLGDVLIVNQENGSSVPDWMYLRESSGGFTPSPAAGVGVPLFRFASLGDFDGDGRTDLLWPYTNFATPVAFNDGIVDGTFVFRLGPALPRQADGGFVSVGDFNGDGISDFIHHWGLNTDENQSNDSAAMYFGRGDRSFAYSSHPNMAVLERFSGQGDFDGDGATDLITYLSAFLDISVSPDNQIFRSRGCEPAAVGATEDLVCGFSGLGNPSFPEWVFIEFADDAGNPAHARTRSVQLFDYNGDGLHDVFFDRNLTAGVFSDPPYAVVYLNRRTTLPDLLTSVRNGLGAVTDMFYKPLSDAATYSRKNNANNAREHEMFGSYFVVNRVRTSNGVGGQTETFYKYRGAIVDRHGRGFLGFAEVEEMNVDRNVRQTTFYHQKFPTTGLVNLQQYQVVDTVPTGTAATIKSASYFYETIATIPGAWFPALKSQMSVDFDPTKSTLEVLSLGSTDLTYDSFGNRTTAISKTAKQSLTSPDVTRTVTAQFTNKTDDWLIGLPWCTSERALSNGFDETRFEGREYVAGTGKLRKKILDPRGTSISRIDGTTASCGSTIGAAATLATEYTYDAVGEISNTSVRAGDTNGDGSADDRMTDIVYPLAERNKLQPTVTVLRTAPGGIDFSSVQTLDARFGTVAVEVGPNGDAYKTETQRDALGRVYESKAYQSGKLPVTTVTSFVSGCSSSLTTPYVSAHGVYSMTVTRAGGESTTSCYDRLGREIKRATDGASGVLGQYTEYDSRGRVRRVSRNLLEDKWRTFESYDAVHRPLVISEHGSRSITSYNYSGLTSTETVSIPVFQIYADQDQVRTTAKDSAGRNVSITDSLGNVTQYVYDGFNQLRRIEPPGGSFTEVSFTYDSRGRMTKMRDPDLGGWLYSYYLTGERAQTTDGNGVVTEELYDRLGRLTKRVVGKGRTNEEVTTYTYDTSPRGGTVWLNKLHTVETKRNNTTTYKRTEGYDVTTALPNGTTLDYGAQDGTFTTLTTYDDSFRVKSLRYPDGNFTVNYQYSDRGKLLDLRDGANALLWKPTSYSPNGQLTNAASGNGIATRWGYDSETGFLSSIETGIPGATGPDGSIQKLSYLFTARGNLRWRQDLNQPATSGSTIPAGNTANPGFLFEQFGYDPLGRVTSSQVFGNNAPQDTYAYDNLGNLINRSDVGTLTYDVLRKPHAVRNVTLLGGNPGTTGDVDGNGFVNFEDYRQLITHVLNAGTLTPAGTSIPARANCNGDATVDVNDLVCQATLLQNAPASALVPSRYAGSYEYDANGNMISGAGRTITYTAFNKPNKIVQVDGNKTTTVEFGHDADTGTIKKTTTVATQNGTTVTTAKTTTVFVGGIYDRSIDASNQITAQYYVRAEGRVVAVRTKTNGDESAAKIDYAHTDHLNSISVMTDGAGNVVAGSQKSFGPFGSRRAATGWGASILDSQTASAKLGFTGQYQIDEIEVVDMNARLYDPVLGRFMSADTLIPDTSDLQSLNRYSYVYNNPLRYIDPTGHEPGDASTYGSAWNTEESNGTDYSLGSPPEGWLEFDSDAGIGLGSRFTDFGETSLHNSLVDESFGSPELPQIVKYGESRDTPFREYAPFAYSQALAYDRRATTSHWYVTDNEVCSASARCTNEMIRYYMSIYGVPGWTEPVSSGNRYFASDPITGFAGGQVYTEISADGLSITNTTLPGHNARHGSIVREAYQLPDGEWRVRTVGFGNNLTSVHARLNEVMGRAMFNYMDRGIAMGIAGGR